MMDNQIKTGIPFLDEIMGEGLPMGEITVIGGPVRKRPSLSRPGCDLVLCIRRRGMQNPITRRPSYRYELVKSNENGTPKVGSYSKFHEADFIVGADGTVFKNRWGHRGCHASELSWEHGGREAEEALFWLRANNPD
jgi:hypothetical protein